MLLNLAIVIQGQNEGLLRPARVRLMHTKAPVAYALPVQLLCSVLFRCKMTTYYYVSAYSSNVVTQCVTSVANPESGLAWAWVDPVNFCTLTNYFGSDCCFSIFIDKQGAAGISRN